MCRTDLHLAERDLAPTRPGVPVALRGLDRGGTPAVAGIHLSGIPALSSSDTLFQEHRLRSVTADTRSDGEEFLRLAVRHGITATTEPYDFADAGRALSDLAHGRVTSAAVLHVG